MKPSLRQRRVLKGLLALISCVVCAAAECNCPCIPNFNCLVSSYVAGFANGEASITVESGDLVSLTNEFCSSYISRSSLIWEQQSPATPTVAFQRIDEIETQFTAPEVTESTVFQLKIRIAVADDITADTIQVTVNPRSEAARPIPIVELQVNEGDMLTLDGAAVLDPLSFDPASFNPQVHQAIWHQTSTGPQAMLSTDPSSLTAEFIAEFVPTPDAGPLTLSFRLDVFDGSGNLNDPDTALASAEVNVDVLRRPIADAGPYQLVIRQQTQTVQLDGSASLDMDTPGDNSGLSFIWVQIEGPPVQLSNPLIAAPEFSIADLAANRNHRLVFALAVVNGPAAAGPILAATTLEEVQAAIAGLLADVDTVEIAIVRRPGGAVAPEGPEEAPCDPACEAPAECIDGMCLIPCADEFCELDQVCGEGGCVEPCGEGFCEPGEVCTDDGCLIPCGEGFCARDEACNEEDVCVVLCDGAECEPGQACGEGGCGEPCDGGVCAPGEACIDGEFCGELCDGQFCGFEGLCDPGCGCDFDFDQVGDLCDQCPGNPFATEEPCEFPQ